MGKSSKITIGHNYFMGLHMGICRGPVDEIVEIKVGDRTAWAYNPDATDPPVEDDYVEYKAYRHSGNAATTAPGGKALFVEKFIEQDHIEWNEQITGSKTIQIKAKKLFGGEESEGGVEGTCDVMMGASDQSINNSLADMLGGLVPAFRGRVTLFFDGLVCSLSKYPKPWQFRIRRALNGWDGSTWYAEKCVIWLDDNKIYAMNGAHILFEALTNRDWGRGKPRAKLDESSFIAAADRLYSENFGLCCRWARQDNVRNFIRDVLAHIGANLFPHPVTGLWTLRLVRDDYDINDLPLFDADSGLLGIDDDDNAAIANGANEIIVNYIRPEDGEEGSVRAPNLAAIRASGGTIPEIIDYPFLPTPELALRIAQRDLRAKFGLKKFKIRLDRRGYQIEPGGVFRISAPERGIDNLVLRAGEIDDGQISSGIITVTAVMDVFGLPDNSFIQPQPSLWTPPEIDPQPIVDRVIGEATYRDLAASLDAARFEDLTPGTNLVTSIASKSTSLSIDYDLQSRVGTTNWLTASAEFTPTAELSAEMLQTNDRVTVTLTNMVNVQSVELGTAALIDNEIFRVDAIDESDGFCMLARGCIDTVPAVHAAGALVYFYQDAIGVDSTEYAVGVTVQTRLISRTGSGELNIDLAPVDNHIITGRRERPYPPGLVKLNGLSYPSRISGEVIITWVHRDKVIQADQLVDQSVASIGPESGITYHLIINGEGGTPIIDTEVASTSFVLSKAQETLLGSPVNYLPGRDLVTSALSLYLTGPLPPPVSIPAPSLGDSGITLIPEWAGSSSPPFSVLAGVYRSVIPPDLPIELQPSWVDPYTGWAIDRDGELPWGQDQSIANPETSSAIPPIPAPQSANDTFVWSLNSKSGSVRYWASTAYNRRQITHYQSTLSHGANYLIDDHYYASMGQFDSASGQFFGGFAPITNASQGSANAQATSVDKLIYIPHRAVLTTDTTSGKTVNITNLLTGHLTIVTSCRYETIVARHEADGTLKKITDLVGHRYLIKSGHDAALEFYPSTRELRTVNVITGLSTGLLLTLPHPVVSVAVDFVSTGDIYALLKISDGTYLAGYRYEIYRYNAAGVLLGTFDLINLFQQEHFARINNWFGVTALQIAPDALFVGVSGVSHKSFLGPIAGAGGDPEYVRGTEIFRLVKDLSSFNYQDPAIIFTPYLVGTYGGSDLRFDYFRALPDKNYYEAKVTRMYSAAGTSYVNPNFGELNPAGAPAEISEIATPRLNDALNIKIASIKNNPPGGGISGLLSHQYHDITTQRTGWGKRWSKHWSGGT